MITLEEKTKKLQNLKNTVRNVLFYVSRVYNCTWYTLVHILIFDIYNIKTFYAKFQYIERQNIIEEHARNKRKLEEEKQLNDLKEKMATKIQAWWRGTMVRRHLGPYKHLLGPRKKSIKKQQISKGKKSKRNS